MKQLFLLSIVMVIGVAKSWAQADPGSSGMSFDKSKFYIHETGVLYVTVGNYSEYLATGKNLLPYDATFTITIPSDLKVNGSVNLSGLPFVAVVANHTTSYNGSTIIVIALPNGIAKGLYGTLSIPVMAQKENPDILYASVKTDANLNTPSSGNAIPNNDLVHAPVTVCAPLPVKLKGFAASSEGLVSELNWDTTEEVNSERFDIEHSMDTKIWNVVGSVASHGSSTENNFYHFSHENPGNGKNYYRLKLVDQDGTSAFSTIRYVEVVGAELLVYPNPVVNHLRIKGAGSKVIESVQMINQQGSVVWSGKNRVDWDIDVQHLEPGTYFVKIVQKANQVVTKKVLIAH